MAFSRRHENLVALFRGLPGLPSKGRPRPIKEAANLMDALMEKHKLLQPRIENELNDQWSYIVGDHNATRCRPKNISNGVVRAVCDNPSLVTELNFNRKMILRRLHSACPSLKDIRFGIG